MLRYNCWSHDKLLHTALQFLSCRGQCRPFKSCVMYYTRITINPVLYEIQSGRPRLFGLGKGLKVLIFPKLSTCVNVVVFDYFFYLAMALQGLDEDLKFLSTEIAIMQNEYFLKIRSHTLLGSTKPLQNEPKSRFFTY